MSQNKKRVAVLFGGRSPEHDVSVVSGLQILGAIDQTRYEAFPVYVTADGEWLVGDVLRERANYMLSAESRKKTMAVTLDMSASKIGRLLPKKSGLFSKGDPIEFDVALPVFHGLYGEDGCVQGALELCGVAYGGMRIMASTIMMDKVATKRILNDLDIPHLPYGIIERPQEGYFIPAESLKEMVGGIDFPMILKPAHLGSSIGVAKVNSFEELSACLPPIFEMDDVAIVEPFVKNLVEYNVAVGNIAGEIKTSAIERPKAQDELLDFKQKYLSGGGKTGDKLGGGSLKTPGTISEGMLSLTRELNPALDKDMEEKIRSWAARLYGAMGRTGAPRIDFISDSKTGEIWMNEVNPIPGSYGYFLWEAASEPLLFADFLSNLIEEALAARRKKSLLKDPVPKEARLFKR
ncbi:MAG: D-alanine--D-alanine ligase [Alphaproteobacteria bacterium]|nr:D-alanine--D-alanine ligase [Alphaproteobacteria bacterium]